MVPHCVPTGEPWVVWALLFLSYYAYSYTKAWSVPGWNFSGDPRGNDLSSVLTPRHGFQNYIYHVDTFTIIRASMADKSMNFTLSKGVLAKVRYVVRGGPAVYYMKALLKNCMINGYGYAMSARLDRYATRSYSSSSRSILILLRERKINIYLCTTT